MLEIGECAPEIPEKRLHLAFSAVIEHFRRTCQEHVTTGFHIYTL